MPQTLTITMNDDGAISLAGPLPNMLLCLGLLELGKLSLVKWHEEQKQRVKLADLSQVPQIGGN